MQAELPRSLYVHVPFCRHRCGYCDFTLVAGQDELIERYLSGLKEELRQRQAVWQNWGYGDRLTLDTLFLGGGTPTHLSPGQLQQLYATLSEFVELADGAELSVEANPLDLHAERLSALQKCGVNRLSVGVQSFSAAALQLLERDHSPADILQQAPRWGAAIPNWSMDLIFGVPGQTLDDWRSTLQQAVSLEPTHLSVYGLTFETGTAFTVRRDRGQLRPAPEDLEADQYTLAMDLLSVHCYEQYEIASFAQPGAQCRHNLLYWSGAPYEAIGPGAARYLCGRRETNSRSVRGWLARVEARLSPTSDVDELPPEHRARELVFVGLRRVAGVDRADFLQRTRLNLDDLAGEVIARYVEQGLLLDDGRRIALTRAGRLLADRVISDFL